jgi:hypothetical protein
MGNPLLNILWLSSHDASKIEKPRNLTGKGNQTLDIGHLFQYSREWDSHGLKKAGQQTSHTYN